MPGAPRGIRHELEPQRLEPEKDVGVEQRAWMNAKKLHWNLRNMRSRSYDHACHGQATSGIRYQQPLMATDLRGQRSRGNFHDKYICEELRPWRSR